MKDIANNTLEALYRTMLSIRKVQLKIEQEYPKDEMKTPVHLCTGQEAIPAGVCANLNKDDYLFSNYRGHGHYLAKGGNLKALISELYCKESGCSKGRGGSMHTIDVEAGLMGSSSIVAGGIPIATGAALGSLIRKDGKVSVVFFGDGAVDEGVLYESVNFAVLKKLPVIYACENNFYAVCSPAKNRHADDNIYKRFSGCGIEGRRVDGNNVIDVYRAAKEAVEKARQGGGPSFIELRTYRWHGHSGGGSDIDLGYRAQAELDQWLERCPVENFKRFLFEKGVLTEEKHALIEDAIDNEVNEAFCFAQDSPLPNNDHLHKDLYED